MTYVLSNVKYFIWFVYENNMYFYLLSSSLSYPILSHLIFSGVNGAGKSTTLNILTGDVALSNGEVFVAGQTLSDPLTRSAIGFCPQTDPVYYVNLLLYCIIFNLLLKNFVRSYHLLLR